MSLQSEATKALEDCALQETRDLLTEWGLWAIDGQGLPTGARGTLEGIIQRSGHRSTMLTDDQAMRVDRAVAALWQRRPGAWRAVYTYYTHPEMTQVGLAKALRVSRPTAASILSAGESWVDAWLESN